jgi:hypothetical protein
MPDEYKMSPAERAAYANGWDARGARVDELIEALLRIMQWSEAYPLDVFPEPDLKRAHELLQVGGITLGAVSASMARHVISGVGKIARDALGEKHG